MFCYEPGVTRKQTNYNLVLFSLLMVGSGGVGVLISGHCLSIYFENNNKIYKHTKRK